jgi:SAM-dependent methyltransferase
MINTLHFNFIHVPKTGGRWIRQVLDGNLPAEWRPIVNYRSHSRWHMGLPAIPPLYQGKPTLAFVRNPWDWYVSIFSHFRHDHPPGDDIEVFRRQLPLLMKTGATWSSQPVITHGGELACTVKRYEDGVREQLVAFMDRACPGGTPPGVLDAMNTFPPANVSKRGPYQLYYTPRMVEAVRRHDAWLIHNFSYEFEMTVEEMRMRLEDLNRDHHRRMHEGAVALTKNPDREAWFANRNRQSMETLTAAMLGCHQRAKMGANGRLLELGCGNGQEHKYVVPTLGASHYTGIEVVKECAEARTDIDCHHLSIEEMPRNWKRRFKWIYSRHVMEHVLDLDASLAAIKRSLAPNGVLGAVTPHVFPDHEPAHVTLQTLQEWCDHYRRHGLRPVYAMLHDYACLEAHIVCIHQEFPFEDD